MRNIAIIGAGSWGTALALVAARAGQPVRLWAHSQEVVETLRRTRENQIYLPGFVLPENVTPAGELAEALSDAELVMVKESEEQEEFEELQKELASQEAAAAAERPQAR